MNDDVIRKIRGLLATAESLAESGNDEAAGAYIAKAHALQQKHSIDDALLESAEGTTKPVVVTRTWVMPGRHGRRKVDLAHAVSRNSGCTGYFSPGSAHGDGAYRFTVFGFPQDVEWAETLTFSLCHQADSALVMAREATVTDRTAAAENRRSFATSFLAGFTSVVARRLREAAAEAEATVQAAAGPTSVALVLAGKSARVDEEMRASVPHLRTSRTGGGTSRSGYERGRHAGRRATLARGAVGGTGPGQLGGR